MSRIGRGNARGAQRLGAIVGALCAALATVLTAAEGRALDGVREGPAGQPVILFLVTDSPATPQLGRALAAIRAHLGDLPVQLAVETLETFPVEMAGSVKLATLLAKRSGAIGAFWLELDEGGDVLLYLAEPQGLRVLVRRVPPGKAARAAVLEEVALIARSTIEALLEGAEIGLRRAPIRPSSERSPTHPPTSESWPHHAPPSTLDLPAPTHASAVREERHFVLATSYFGNIYTSETTWQSGGRISAQLFASQHVYAGVSYTLIDPVSVQAPQVTTVLFRHMSESFVGLTSAQGSLEALLELGILLDYVTRSTRSNDPRLFVTEDRGRMGFGFSARFGVAWAPLRRTRLFTLIGADTFLNNFAYEMRGADPPILAQPHAIRPRLDLGISFEIW